MEIDVPGWIDVYFNMQSISLKEDLVKTEELEWIAKPALSGEMLNGRQRIAENLLDN